MESIDCESKKSRFDSESRFDSAGRYEKKFKFKIKKSIHHVETKESDEKTERGGYFGTFHEGIQVSLYSVIRERQKEKTRNTFVGGGNNRSPRKRR